MTTRKHLICILHADGRSEWFSGWNKRGEPDLSSNREDASSYDLTYHRDEALNDYERLCEMGFDASIETVGRGSRLAAEASAYVDVFQPRAGLLGLIVRGANLQAAE